MAKKNKYSSVDKNNNITYIVPNKNKQHNNINNTSRTNVSNTTLPPIDSIHTHDQKQKQNQNQNIQFDIIGVPCRLEISKSEYELLLNENKNLKQENMELYKRLLKTDEDFRMFQTDAVIQRQNIKELQDDFKKFKEEHVTVEKLSQEVKSLQLELSNLTTTELSNLATTELSNLTATELPLTDTKN